MNNGDMPAFSQSVAVGTAGDVATSLEFDGADGLTKREYFAAMAMQAMVTNKVPEDNYIIERVAEYSVSIADALLKALEEE